MTALHLSSLPLRLLWLAAFLYVQPLLMVAVAFSFSVANNALNYPPALVPLALWSWCVLGGVGFWRCLRSPEVASASALRWELALLALGCAGALGLWALLSLEQPRSVGFAFSLFLYYILPPVALGAFEMHRRWHALSVRRTEGSAPQWSLYGALAISFPSLILLLAIAFRHL